MNNDVKKFIKSVQQGKLEEVKEILEKNPKFLNKTYGFLKYTPVLWAAYYKQTNILDYLIENQAKLYEVGKNNVHLIYFLSIRYKENEYKKILTMLTNKHSFSHIEIENAEKYYYNVLGKDNDKLFKKLYKITGYRKEYIDNKFSKLDKKYEFIKNIINDKLSTINKVKIDLPAYKGYRKIFVTKEFIDSLYSKKSIFYNLEADALPFKANEHVIFYNKHSHIAKYNINDRLFYLIDYNKISKIFGISPKSNEERILVNLLMSPNIKLVTLVAEKHSNKLLLAMAAALESVTNNSLYNKLIITKINSLIDKGDLLKKNDKKLVFQMPIIMNNLELLLLGGIRTNRTNKRIHNDFF